MAKWWLQSCRHPGGAALCASGVISVEQICTQPLYLNATYLKCAGNFDCGLEDRWSSANQRIGGSIPNLSNQCVRGSFDKMLNPKLPPKP